MLTYFSASCFPGWQGEKGVHGSSVLQVPGLLTQSTKDGFSPFPIFPGGNRLRQQGNFDTHLYHLYDFRQLV